MSEGKIDEVKFDRQLRLWGTHGQARLERARVCCVGADALASETLKNLVLPNVGHVTLLDAATVTLRDTGENFFVDKASVGQPRAAVVARLLNELNPACECVGEAGSLADRLADDAFWARFSHVVVSNEPNWAAVRQLAARLWTRGVPLVLVDSCGFLGRLRVVAPEHCVSETKSDNAIADLRVAKPFAALLAHATRHELASLDSAAHGHEPWICVLVQHTQRWRDAHGGQLPQTRDEKKAFKEGVRALARAAHEENFAEAYAQAHTGYSPYRLPFDVRAVLDNERAKPDAARQLPLERDAPPFEPGVFWRVAAGIAAFVQSATEGGGKLPLAGSVPDLTATTDGFLALQNIYQAKAAQDADAVFAHIKTLFGDEDADKIGLDTVRQVCRKVNELQCVLYRSLEQEYTDGMQRVAPMLGDASSDAHWYVVWRAAETVRAELDAAPSDDAKLQALRAGVRKVLGDGAEHAPSDDHLKHWLRADNSRLHNTAAVLGGIASQELIKVIVHQYVPLNNTFIWNGIKGTSITLEV